MRAGVVVVACGVHELPGASGHGARVDGADFGGEALFVALVDEDGLGDGRVGDVHGETPVFLVFVHVHEFGHVRQFGGGESGGAAEHGAGFVHLLGDAGALGALPVEVALQSFEVAACAGPRVDGGGEGFLAFAVSFVVFAFEVHGVDAAFVPGLFVAGQRLADGCERLFDSCSVGLHVFEGAAGLVEFEFESGQVAAVQTLHLASDHVEAGAQVFGSAAQQLGFRLAVLLFGAVGGQLGGDFAAHAGQCPVAQHGRHRAVDGRLDRFEGAGLAACGGVFAVGLLDAAQRVHAAGFLVHGVEVPVVTFVVLDRGAGQAQGFGHAEHALFEDVVEPGGRVGGLDLVQQSAGGLAQAHCAPDVCVERFGAGECEAVGVGGFELGRRERGVTVLVHAPGVHGLAPDHVLAAHVAAAVAGHQVEEFGAGKHLAGGLVAIGVHDGAPHGLRRAVLVAAAQVERLVAGFGAAHADHAAQVGVVAAFGAAGVRGLVERRAGRVQQGDLRVDQRGFAGFTGAGEQGHRQLVVRGGAEFVVALIGAPVDESAGFQHPPVRDHLHVCRLHHSAPFSSSSSSSVSPSPCSATSSQVSASSRSSTTGTSGVIWYMASSSRRAKYP